MENSKKNTKIALIIIFLLALVGVAVYFIFFNKEEVAENNDNKIVEEENNDDERVVSKNVAFGVDSFGYLQMVADVTLSEPLQLTEQLDMIVKTYNENGKLLHTFLASTSEFKIDNETEVHLGFDCNETSDFDEISYITTEISINEKTTESDEDYEFITNNEPDVVDYVSMYRVFMDLSDFYYDNSGLALVEYEDGTSFVERISYLTEYDFIGIAMDYDFTTNTSGSNIAKVSVYRIAYLWEQ